MAPCGPPWIRHWHSTNWVLSYSISNSTCSVQMRDELAVQRRGIEPGPSGFWDIAPLPLRHWIKHEFLLIYTGSIYTLPVNQHHICLFHMQTGVRFEKGKCEADSLGGCIVPKYMSFRRDRPIVLYARSTDSGVYIAIGTNHGAGAMSPNLRPPGTGDAN